MGPIEAFKQRFGRPGLPRAVVGQWKQENTTVVSVADQHGLIVQPFHAGGTTKVADQQVNVHALLHHGVVDVRVGPNLAGHHQQQQHGHEGRQVPALAHGFRSRRWDLGPWVDSIAACENHRGRHQSDHGSGCREAWCIFG